MTDETFMAEAILEALKAKGKAHPNPRVGAVISDGQKIVACGHTQPVGKAHAEVSALGAMRESGISPHAGHTLSVTMEPCSTHGRTPPCTDAIIASGIKRVVIGTEDPNPAHKGKAKAILQSAGIEVISGVMAKECEDLNLIFNHAVTKKTPLIAGKIATTLDGSIATRAGFSKWITGTLAREDVMHWRAYFPAIAVGAGTVLADNPNLTARFETETICPIRFVFDRHLITLRETPPIVYTDPWAARTILVTSEERAIEAEDQAKALPIQIWGLPNDSSSEAFIAFRQKCMEKEIHGVYIEGGSSLLSRLLNTKNLDYLFAYRAPKIMADPQALSAFQGREPGEIKDSIHLKTIHHAFFGDDQLMRGFIINQEG